MTNWWRWQGAVTAAPDRFAVIGVGRFGTAVCKELVHCGAEVLAINRDQRASKGDLLVVMGTVQALEGLPQL